MPSFALLLALVLIVGGAAYAAQADRKSDHGHGSHNEHHDHHQAPPLLEMLPPIGPAGFVLMGVMGDYYLSRYDHDGHGHEGDGHGHEGDGHGHEGEGGREDNEEQIQLPRHGGSSLSSKDRPFVINVTPGGTYIVRTEMVELDHLRVLLKETFQETPDRKVLIRGDASLPEVTDAVVAIEAAGFPADQIGLDTN